MDPMGFGPRWIGTTGSVLLTLPQTERNMTMNMKTTSIAVFSLVAGSSFAVASVEYGQNVTGNVIFGSGNANGGFTTTRSSGLEIGIRGKLRFDAANNPQNIYNSNGDGSYTFAAGNPPTGFGFDPGNPTTPIWNFDWSVNTDFDGSAGGKTVDAYTYQLGMDADASMGTNFMTFDFITAGVAAPFWDHSFGNNSTAANSGAEAGDLATYNALAGANNIVQNSWSYEFFNSSSPLSSFDPTVVGNYEIYIAAFDGLTEIGRTTITIDVVPTPGSLALLGLGGITVTRRRRA